MDVANLPKYWNSSNITNPYLLQPSKLLSPNFNKFFGTGAIDGTLDSLVRKIFPNLPPNPSLVRNHGIRDAMELTEMFNKGKMHIDLGNLERGRPPVTNSAVWGLDNWNNPQPKSNIAQHIYNTSQPDYAAMGNASQGVDFTPFLGKFSSLLDKKESIIAEKSPKIAALLEKVAKTIEKNKKNEYLMPLVGAGLGGAIPMASLGQYWLNDYAKIRNAIENVPIMDGKKLNQLAKPGDVGASGAIDSNKFHFLGDGSRYTTGNPAGHGFTVGKYKKLYHAGALGGHIVNIPERYRVDGGSATVADRLGNILEGAIKIKNSKDKNLLRRIRRGLEHVNATDRVREKLVARASQQSNIKGVKPHRHLDNLPKELKLEHEAGEDIFALLFRNKKLTTSQKNRILQKVEKNTVLPYSVADAVSTGASRVMAPRSKGKTELNCSGTMCGDNIGAVHSVTGKGTKGRGMPVDVFLDPDFKPVGVAASKNMSKKRLRAAMLESLRQAAKGRTLLGLAGTGAGMGLGTGLGLLGNNLEAKLKALFKNDKNPRASKPQSKQ